MSDLVPVINDNIQKPGDKMTQVVTPNGDIVTKLDTKTKKVTHRQYNKERRLAWKANTDCYAA